MHLQKKGENDDIRHHYRAKWYVTSKEGPSSTSKYSFCWGYKNFRCSTQTCTLHRSISNLSLWSHRKQLASTAHFDERIAYESMYSGDWMVLKSSFKLANTCRGPKLSMPTKFKSCSISYTIQVHSKEHFREQMGASGKSFHKTPEYVIDQSKLWSQLKHTAFISRNHSS